MSAFLGPIHTWLFNKIKFQDELTKVILEFAKEKNYEIELLDRVDQRCGVLETGELADIIDGSNIHGWLQERISIIESRLAFVVTVITDEHPERIIEINDSVYEYGKQHAVEKGITAKEAYKYLEDQLLNGMPCDRVNNILDETENAVTWEQTIDIHESYWNMIHGNVEYYYAIRESLIVGMFENSGIIFEQTGKQIFVLRKEA